MLNLKPIIGVTASLREGTITLENDVLASILESKGIPYILP